jgi:hypothetical protein
MGIQAIAANSYLFLVALYFLLASAHLINVLVMVESNVGPYFEFMSAPMYRLIVYTLGFATVLYPTLKFRKIPLVLGLASIPAGYLTFMQMVDVFPILISFFALVWLITSPCPFSMMRRKKAVSLVVTYLISILIIVEISSLICWSTFPFHPELSQQGTGKYLVDLETKISLLTGSLAPVFAVLFLFSWVAKPFLSRNKLLRRPLQPFVQANDGSNNVQLMKWFPPLLLASAIVLSFIVALYPYAPRLNVGVHPIGVDFPFYEGWLAKSANAGFFNVVADSFFKYSDRPLSLVILYLARYATGLTASNLVQFSPIIICPLLVLAVYFFMLEADGSGCTPLLAAFLSVSSFYISVGMFAFFLSNWMALIELYLFMGFYFSSLRKKSPARMAAALLLSISLLFTHSWTWAMAITVLVVYLLLLAISKRKKIRESRFEVQILIILILINVLVGIARNYALGLSAGNFETLELAQSTVSTGALASFWDTLLHTFMQTMDGFFVNPTALLLAALGGIIVALDDKPVNRYLTSWLIVSSIFFLLTSGWTIKGRILFNIPMPVFETLGLVGISSIAGKVSEPSIRRSIKLSIILLVLLATLNYAFRSAFVLSQV